MEVVAVEEEEEEKEKQKQENNSNENLLQYAPDFDENFDYFSYYDSANRDIEKLIETRRAWDAFIVPSGVGGSRIPQHFVQPPYPSSDSWAEYLIQPTSI
eukprot:c22213_g1_i1.p1 GENE.c22213_g1_i1~~c22213_g1_i1.p1  ORF type:complete len:100 (-),score=48.28 c22213_g1_i1:70-369(-)